MTRLLAVLLLGATPALAVDPWTCPDVLTRAEVGAGGDSLLPFPGEDPDIRLRWGPGQVTDMGAGIVATETVEERLLHGEEGLRFEHCASGQGFHVTVRAWDETGERRLGPDAYALMRDVIASPERNTWDEVRRMYGGFAGPLTTSPVESCACAAFYPDLRDPSREPFTASARD